MDTNTKYVIGIVVVVIIAIGAYAAFGHRSPAPVPAASEMTASSTTDMNGMDMGTSGTNSAPDTSGGTGTSGGSGVSVGAGAGVTTDHILVVTYTDTGFSPSAVTIDQGQSVEFVDNSAGPMWVATNPHPVHTGYDGTSMSVHCAPGYAGAAPFDECGTGSTYTFTFGKAGTWGYHNHLNPSAMGTITVTAGAASGTN